MAQFRSPVHCDLAVNEAKPGTVCHRAQ